MEDDLEEDNKKEEDEEKTQDDGSDDDSDDKDTESANNLPDLPTVSVIPPHTIIDDNNASIYDTTTNPDSANLYPIFEIPMDKKLKLWINKYGTFLCETKLFVIEQENKPFNKWCFMERPRAIVYPDVGPTGIQTNRYCDSTNCFQFTSTFTSYPNLISNNKLPLQNQAAQTTIHRANILFVLPNVEINWHSLRRTFSNF